MELDEPESPPVTNPMVCASNGRWMPTI